MNYYSHNIGDYAQATMHLSLVEDAIYTRLLRRYYAEEQPIVDDLQQVCRWVGARADDEREAVAVILREFFELRDGNWHNKRADEEIAKYRAKAAQASENGKRGGRPRKAEGSGCESKNNPEETNPVFPGLQRESGSKANQEPRTNNQEEQEQKALVPSGDDTGGYSAEFEEFWSAYPKREGGNSKKGAFKAWNARLRSGVKADELILAAKRYAAEQQAAGKVGTAYVKQAATFLGPDEHWREALNSNVHPIRPGRDGSGKLEAGYFYHPDDNGLPLHERRVLNRETHDPATGYLWTYLRKMGMA